jgi:hypothetical protein
MFVPRYVIFETIVNGIISLFIIGVLKSYGFLCVDFASCYFAKSVYLILEFSGEVLGSLSIESYHLQIGII